MAQSCFWKDHDQVSPRSTDQAYPCPSNSTAQAGAAQLCCLVGSKCGLDGLCYAPDAPINGGTYNNTGESPGWYTGGCTDASWTDAICPKQCSDTHSYILWNETGSMWHCCGEINCLDTPFERAFEAASPLQQILNAVASNTSSNDTPTITPSTASCTSSRTSAGTSGLSAGAAAGIGVAVTAIVFSILAAGVFLLLRKKRTKSYDAKEPQAAPGPAYPYNMFHRGPQEADSKRRHEIGTEARVSELEGSRERNA